MERWGILAVKRQEVKHLELRELVETIVDIVLRQYRPQPAKALVLVTGGRMGRETALKEIHKLWRQDWQLRLVLTEAARKVTGPERLGELLPEAELVEEDGAPYSLVKWADIVIIPVLTINTAAKLAAALADNLATTCALEALLMGKPVLAARDAADPSSPDRTGLGMNRGSSALLKRLEQNLTTLEGFGVTLVWGRDLAQAAASLLTGGKCPAALFPTNRRLVTVEDVLRAAAEARGQVLVGPDTIITPLAAERARELGVALTTTAGEG